MEGVNWSRQGGTEIDSSCESKSRTEWEASESERDLLIITCVV